MGHLHELFVYYELRDSHHKSHYIYHVLDIHIIYNYTSLILLYTK